MECDSVLSLLVVGCRVVSCRVVVFILIFVSSSAGRLAEARHKIHITLRKINYGASRGVLFFCFVLFLLDVNIEFSENNI